MTLSIGSGGINYSMLDEIWDNYKYPKQDDYSCTGYDTFNNNKDMNTYTENKNIQGQSVLSNKQPRVQAGNDVIEGFRMGNPMDHPSTSNTGLQNTYNNKPYEKHEKYSHIRNDSPQRVDCDVFMDHIRTCRMCYKHIRDELQMEHDQRPPLFGNIDLTNITPIQIAMVIIGGAFVSLLFDIIIKLKKR